MKHLRTQLCKELLTLLTAVIFAIPVLAAGPKTVTLQLKNATLVQTLQELKKQVDVKFIYSDEELKKANTVTVDLTNVNISTALNLIFRNQPFTYKYSGDGVYVIKPLPRNSRQGDSRTVSGKIVDAQTGEPLIGATIFDAKTRKGGMSNVDGIFVISIPSDCKVVNASFVGYETKVIPLKNDGTLLIALSESSQQLNEVVVTGVVSKSKLSFTGSASQFSGEELKNVGLQNPISSLKALDASFNVLDNTMYGSDPNHLPDINIRGKSSIL